MTPRIAAMARGCALLAALCLASSWPAAAQEAALTYTVQPSDKLIRLGERILRSAADWPEVARFNGLPDANRLQPGQTLRIPLHLLKTRGAPVRVVDVQGDVRAGGQPLAAGALLQEGAALTTAVGSSAVLELADGSRIQVLPQSRLEVTAHRHYLLPETGKAEDASWFASTLRLAQGALDAVAEKATLRAEPLKVITPTGLIGIRGTHFRVGTSSAGRPFTRAEVLDGRVNAVNPARNADADIDAGRGARVDPAVRGIILARLLPRPDLGGLPAELRSGQARLPLPPLGGAEAWYVQVASDAAFQRIVRDGNVLSGGFSLEGLAPGDWYVRVRGVDRNGIEGFDTDRRVTLLAALPAVPQAPRATLSFLRGASGAGGAPAVPPPHVAGFTLRRAPDGNVRMELRWDDPAVQVGSASLAKDERDPGRPVGLAGNVVDLGASPALPAVLRLELSLGGRTHRATYLLETPAGWEPVIEGWAGR